MTLHISEAELAHNLHELLGKVREGDEIVVEESNRAVAVIRAPQPGGFSISESIARALAFEEKLGYSPIPDPDFAKDVQAAIDSRREPFHPPAWD